MKTKKTMNKRASVSIVRNLIIAVIVILIMSYLISKYILGTGENIGETMKCNNLPLGEEGSCVSRTACNDIDGKIIPGNGYCEEGFVCCVQGFFS